MIKLVNFGIRKRINTPKTFHITNNQLSTRFMGLEKTYLFNVVLLEYIII